MTRTSRLTVGLFALLACGAPILGCDRLEEAIEEEAEERVRERAGGELPPELNENGNESDGTNENRNENLGVGPGLVGNSCDPAEEPPPEEEPVPDSGIVVNRVEPNFGLIEGGELVTVIGRGFREGDQVLLGGAAAAAESTVFFNENRVEIITPARSAPGSVAVEVRRPETREAGVLPDGYLYLQRPEILSVTPTRGPIAGGTAVEIRGSAFTPGTEVFFGEVQADAFLVDDTTFIATAPELEPQLYTVSVVNTAGRGELEDVYKPFEPVRLEAMRPRIADLSGGSTVLALGRGLVPNTTVTLGEDSLLTATTNFLEREAPLTIGPGATEGPVDVVVSNGYGTDALSDGLVYVDFADPTPRIVATLPNAALASGGSPLTIVGVGFEDPNPTVTLDGAPATCVAQSSFVIECVAPPGAAGSDAALRVVSGATDLTSSQAIRYVPLEVDVVVDDQGARAGGTFVTVYGSGFDDSSELFFDDRPAVDVNVESDTVLTARTPPGNLGLADVRVATRGVSDTAFAAFEYFDPMLTNLWTSGGPIVGSVNVTLFDDVSGQPIPGAFVLLGTSETPTYSGFTDALGQITLSGPDVVGPLTVTAARSGFEYEPDRFANFTTFSYVDVNARDLVIPMFRPGPASTPIPGGPGTSPIVFGNVTRLKDPTTADDDVVIMTTTQALLGFPLPDPGPEATLVNSGPFEMITRTGDLVVIALAGEINDATGDFEVKAMGFSPAFTAESCGIYQYDLVVDTPLDTPLSIRFEDPPLAGNPNTDPDFAGPLPDAARAVIYYDFGGAGVHPMYDLRVFDTDQLFASMPSRLPEPHAATPFVVSSAGYYDGIENSFDSSISLAYPLSLARVGERTDPSVPIVVGPMLGVPHNVSPAAPEDGGSIVAERDAPLQLEVGSSKPDLPTASIYRFEGSDGISRSLEWLVITPGGARSFELPPPAISSLSIPQGAYSVRMQRLREPSTQYNALDLDGLLGAQYFSESRFSFTLVDESPAD